MCYYSDVGLCVSKRGMKTLEKSLRYLDQNHEMEEASRQYIHHLLCLPSHMGDRSGACAWYWKDIKWYDESEEIRFIETLLDSIDRADFLFMRIGEDWDDTEWRGDFYDNPFDMRITRGLSFA